MKERGACIMNEQAKAASREYWRKYREANKEKVNAYQRKWRKANPDKVKAAQKRYWEKKAAEAAEGGET